MKLVIRYRDRDRYVSIDRDGSGVRLELDQTSMDLDVRSLDGHVRSILWDGSHHDIAVRHLGDDHFEVSGEFGSEVVQVLDPLAHLAATSHEAEVGAAVQRVEAYMPGKVVALLAAEGEAVTAGAGVLVLEAMKMENEIQSERAGTIRKIFVAAGDAVEGGDPLYELE